MRWLVLVVLAVAVGCGSDEPEASEPTTTQTAVETTTTEAAATTIPGLAPVDVYGNLEDRGWECDGPDDRLFVCTFPTTVDEVTIHTATGADVVSVEGEVFAASSYQWLEFLATVPFDGADPAGAQAWVAANVAAGVAVEETFGGVPFRLAGEGESRSLTIG